MFPIDYDIERVKTVVAIVNSGAYNTFKLRGETNRDIARQVLTNLFNMELDRVNHLLDEHYKDFDGDKNVGLD